MDLFYTNTHCHHIILAVLDDGFAGYLDTFAKVNDINKKITIVNSPHMPRQMRRTALQFSAANFDHLFRSNSLVGPAFQNLSPVLVMSKKREAPEEFVPANRTPSPPKYGSSPLQNRDLSFASEKEHPENPYLLSKPTGSTTYFVNRQGQRIDAPLTYDKNFLHYLYEHKSRLCNNYYLRKQCKYGTACTWDHTMKLSAVQVDTLRFKARTSPCRDIFCRDPVCTLGHACPRGAAGCSIVNCKFNKYQHDPELDEVWEVDALTGEKTKVDSGFPQTSSEADVATVLE
jgi:hypothetical protein